MSLFWSVVSDLPESFPCVRGNGYYWNMIIDVGVVRRLGIRLR